MNTSKPDIILYGGPASGKSTQAELLVKKLSAEHLNMGGLLRQAAAVKNHQAELIKQYMEAGKLVPEKITAKLMQNFIVHTPKRKRIVFDGYPRSLQQIKNLASAIKTTGRTIVLVFINLPVKAARDRIVRRAKLEGRIDDTDLKVINRRIRIFKIKAKVILAYYRRQKTLIRINGDQTIPQVHRDVLTAIKNL